MKITVTVDFDLEIDEGVDPNDIVFDLKLEDIKPVSLITGKSVGKTLGYATGEYMGEDPE